MLKYVLPSTSASKGYPILSPFGQELRNLERLQRQAHLPSTDRKNARSIGFPSVFDGIVINSLPPRPPIEVLHQLTLGQRQTNRVLLHGHIRHSLIKKTRFGAWTRVGRHMTCEPSRAAVHRCPAWQRLTLSGYDWPKLRSERRPHEKHPAAYSHMWLAL